MSMDTLLLNILAVIALLVGVTSLVLSIQMHQKVKKIFRSAKADNIEELLQIHTKTIEDLLKFKIEGVEYMKSLDKRIEGKIDSSYTVRFNPFPGEGVGGNQSFSSVFADEGGNGVVITGMHTRERTNVFAKPLKDWKSEYELSEEEKEAVAKSKAT